MSSGGKGTLILTDCDIRTAVYEQRDKSGMSTPHECRVKVLRGRRITLRGCHRRDFRMRNEFRPVNQQQRRPEGSAAQSRGTDGIFLRFRGAGGGRQAQKALFCALWRRGSRNCGAGQGPLTPEEHVGRVWGAGGGQLEPALGVHCASE